MLQFRSNVIKTHLLIELLNFEILCLLVYDSQNKFRSELMFVYVFLPHRDHRLFHGQEAYKDILDYISHIYNT